MFSLEESFRAKTVFPACTGKTVWVQTAYHLPNTLTGRLLLDGNPTLTMPLIIGDMETQQYDRN